MITSPFYFDYYFATTLGVPPGIIIEMNPPPNVQTVLPGKLREGTPLINLFNSPVIQGGTIGVHGGFTGEAKNVGPLAHTPKEGMFIRG